jgi:DNA-binding NarL/FixJ family response regulator
VPPSSVLAVDDEPRFRSALRALVEATWPDAELDEAGTGEGAVGLVAERERDVVLIDVRMPGMGGIEATGAIKRMSPETVVLLVSSGHRDELPRKLEGCPADVVVSKAQLRPQLLREVWASHTGRRAAGIGQIAD